MTLPKGKTEARPGEDRQNMKLQIIFKGTERKRRQGTPDSNTIFLLRGPKTRNYKSTDFQPQNFWAHYLPRNSEQTDSLTPHHHNLANQKTGPNPSPNPSVPFVELTEGKTRQAHRY